MKTDERSYLDVAREALEVCAVAVEAQLGNDVDVPDDLDDSAMDSAVFDLFCSIRLARSAEARVRLLTMLVDEPLRPPKKSKKSKEPGPASRSDAGRKK